LPFSPCQFLPLSKPDSDSFFNHLQAILRPLKILSSEKPLIGLPFWFSPLLLLASAIFPGAIFIKGWKKYFFLDNGHNFN